MFRTHSSPRRAGREAVPVRAPFAGDAGYARHAAGLFPTRPVPHEVQASRDGGDSAQLLLHHSLRVPSGAAAARPDPTSRPAHDSQPHGRCLTCWRPRVQCVENSPARLPQAAPLDLARCRSRPTTHVPDTPRVGRSARAQRPRTQRERERNSATGARRQSPRTQRHRKPGTKARMCVCACARACAHATAPVSVGSLRAKGAHATVCVPFCRLAAGKKFVCKGARPHE